MESPSAGNSSSMDWRSPMDKCTQIPRQRLALDHCKTHDSDSSPGRTRASDPATRKFKMKRSAIAIFVKTAGLSPVKTRLAKSPLGKVGAEEFHRLSCVAIQHTVKETLSNVPHLDAY